jgi:hypothetical protein
MNEKYAVGQVSGGVYIIAEGEDDTGRPTFNLMKQDDVRLLLANQPLKLPHITKGGAVEERDECRATAWLKHPLRRTVARVVFSPGEETPAHIYNLWKGWGVQPNFDGGAGCKRIQALLTEVLCDGNERIANWIFDWCAQLVQKPQEKTGVAVVFRGIEGTGKGTFLASVMGRICGSGFLHLTSARHVTSNFNSMWGGTILGFVDEALWAGDKAGEGYLKALITEKSMVVEHKGKNAFSIANHARLGFASNEYWVIPAGPNARRFCVSNVSPRYAKNLDYFAKLRAEIESGGVESFFGWLLQRDFSGSNLREGPVTEGLIEQKLQSLDSIAAWWHARLWAGELAGTEDHLSYGWPETIPANRLFASYLEHCKRVGDRYPQGEEQVAKRLREFAKVDVSRPRGSSGKRERVYTLSSGIAGDTGDMLSGLRGRFEKWIGGPLNWEDEDSSRDSDVSSLEKPVSLNADHIDLATKW